MLHAEVPPLRQPCPPGACDCERETLRDATGADARILQLTRKEEIKLIKHIDSIDTYEGLQRTINRLQEQLGATLRIRPSPNDAVTARGLDIQFDKQLGLCKKTREDVPTAIRRCIGRHEEIFLAVLKEHSLFR
ncbi:hypothetical protein [Rugamonas sp.]|uniref:hypothetical protein n=1 Tax=Rugamonas sp. TaxID=1926287 RepID=UPI0025D91882|nr:hypothetical protein [Rugamonas sp.]